jgi:hypothetical protein
LWLTSFLMRTCAGKFNVSYMNYYSFSNVILLALVSLRVCEILKKGIFIYFIILIFYLVINHYLSVYSWFFDFQQNGAKHAVLILFVLEMMLNKSKSAVLFFYGYLIVASNPIVTSYFLFFMLIILSALQFLLKNISSSNTFNCKPVVIAVICFWIFYVVRVLYLGSIESYFDSIELLSLLPDNLTKIYRDVRFYYRYNGNEFILRISLILLSLGNFIFECRINRLINIPILSILCYLILDLLLYGYLGYKMNYDYQQLSILPLSILFFILFGSSVMLYLSQCPNYKLIDE